MMDKTDVAEATVHAQPADTLLATLCSKVLAGEYAATQLWFDQRVLDRYRAQEGTRVIRTNSAGRVRTASGWAIDFGIAAEDQLIHASAADVSQRVPQSEHQHWLQFLLALPTSRNFLTMRLGGGECVHRRRRRSVLAFHLITRAAQEWLLVWGQS